MSRPNPWIPLGALAAIAAFAAVGWWWMSSDEQPAPSPPADADAAAPDAADPAPPEGSRWVPGARRIYTLRMRETVTRTVSGTPLEPVRYETRGRFSTTITEVDGGRIGLMLAYAPGILETAPESDESTYGLRSELGVPWLAELSADGHVVTTWYVKGLSPMARHIMETITCAIQPVPPPPGATRWARAERHPVGWSTARLELDPAKSTVTKARGPIVMASRRQGPAAAVLAGEVRGDLTATYGLDARGDIDRLSFREVVTFAGHAALGTAESTVELEIRLTEETTAPEVVGALAKDRPRMVPGPTDPRGGGSAVFGGYREAWDTAIVGARETSALLDEWIGAKDDAGRAVAAARLEAALRKRPGDAAAVAGAILAPTTPPEWHAPLAHILSATITAEAREQLLRVATALVDSGAAAAPDVLRALGAARPSSPETIAALSLFAESDDEAVRAAAFAAWGDQVGALMVADPDAANAAASDLLTELDQLEAPEAERLALLALAGTGRPEAIGRAQAALDSESADVRMAAVSAVQYALTPDADALLARTITEDPDSTVRLHAAGVGATRPSPEIGAALARAAALDPDPSVRDALTTLLRTWPDVFPAPETER
jgi:hypothetical protein